MSELETSQINPIKEAEKFACRFLNEGRMDWDKPHSEATAYYTNLLGKAANQDIVVLNIAAWLHDTGYARLFNEGDSKKYDEVLNKKVRHLNRSAGLARIFVNQKDVASCLNGEQKKRIVHLVKTHDKIEDLKDLDEFILMEADTLAQIDLNRVKPSFDYEGGINYIKNLKKYRAPYFQTELGKEILSQLLPPFEEHFQKMASS